MPSSTEVSHELSLAERWLTRALTFVAVGFILLFSYTALRRMHYPFSFDQIEGGMVSSIWHIAHGQQLYVRPTLDFTPFLYAPLYLYLSAAVSKVTGISYVALRLVSFLSTLGTFGLIYAFVYGETRRSQAALAALAAVGLYAACYQPVVGWFDIGRVDSLFVFLFLLAIYCTRRAPVFVAAIVWALAFQTKQGILPIALLIFCGEWQRPRRMLLGMVSTVATVGASILALNHWTHGWYDFYIFGSTRGLTWTWRQAIYYLPVDFGGALGIACLLVFAAVLFTPPKLRSEKTQFYIVASFAIYAAIWFVRSHNGSSLNSLMPAYAWTAVLFGIALARLLSRTATVPTVRVLLLSAAIVQLATHIYSPGRFVPAAPILQARQDLVEQMRSLPGDVYLVGHADDALFAGKKPHAPVDAFGLITQGPPSPEHQALVNELQTSIDAHRFSAFVTDDVANRIDPGDNWLPADFLKQYPVRISTHGWEVGDVTSPQPRERWIYLPCSALNDPAFTAALAAASEMTNGCSTQTPMEGK